MSTSLATGVVAAEVHAELEQSSTSSSRQPPPATAAAETAAAEGLTLAPNHDRPTRRAQSLSARTSPSFHSLSPPVVSPVHDVELSQSVPLSRGRAATSQRVLSQRAPSLSPSQSTFSYGAPSPPTGSDIEAEYPAAGPLVFIPRPAAASVDRARPVAASVDVGRMSLPYASADVGGPRSVVVAHPGSLDDTSLRTRVRSDTPMSSSDVGQRMRVDVSRPLDLTLPIASDDVAHPYAPLSVDVDIGRPASTVSDVAYTLPPGNVDVAGPAYEPAPLDIIDIACTPGPSSVDVPRPTGVSVHRLMPAVGVRPPKASVPIDVVGPSFGPAPPTRVGDMGQQRLGRCCELSWPTVG